MKCIPSLKYDDENYCNYVHFDLSPGIFEENFEIFDELWKLSVLHSYVCPEGTSFQTPTNIFFEVPTLNEELFQKDGFTSKVDFPISVHELHQISIDHTIKEAKISQDIKYFCDKIFNKKNKVNSISQLIEKAAGIFYPSLQLKKELIEPRLLNQFNLFMSHFCGILPKDEKNLAIFLLLLRTNFHIWKMEDIFQDKNNFDSFIILSQQNLFSDKQQNLKWTLLSFSAQEKENKWNTNCLTKVISDKMEDISDSNFLDCDFFKGIINNPEIDVYSNQLNYSNDQAYFFNITKSCFYQNIDKINDIISQKQAAQNIQTALTNTSGTIYFFVNKKKYPNAAVSLYAMRY